MFTTISWQTYSEQGDKKDHNEDACYSTANHAFLMDGHGGETCVNWFHGRLAALCGLGEAVFDIQNGATTALKNLNQEFLAESRPDDFSGSTFIYIFLHRIGVLDVLSLGDSKAIVVGKDLLGRTQWRLLTTSDALEGDDRNLKEVELAKARGNTFRNDRIVSRTSGLSIGMTRALGDRDMRSGEDPAFYEVIDDPHVSRELLQPGDTHIVIASDGLWDVVSEASVASSVCAGGGAEELVRMAKARWAEKGRRADDTTVMVGKIM